MKIAVTGGIGSGKSKVMQLLKQQGYTTFSCDEIYKDVSQSAEYVRQIAEVFPECIKDNTLDKKRLAEIIFVNPERRVQLNAIAHPLIMQSLFLQMQNCNSNLVFAEVPLLFEGKFENDFDFVIIVQRDLEKRISAIKNRDGLSDEEIESRLQSQIDYSSIEFKNYCKEKNFLIIKNNDTIEELKNNLIETLKKFEK